MKIACLVLAAACLPGAPALAHPGGLNAEGCHTNRTTGEYHCHRAPSARPAPRALARSGGARFANCAEVRAAGAAPLRRSDQGYRRGLDRDNDGIACE